MDAEVLGLLRKVGEPGITLLVLIFLWRIDRRFSRIDQWAFGVDGKNGVSSEIKKLRVFKHGVRNVLGRIAARLHMLEDHAKITPSPEQLIELSTEADA